MKKILCILAALSFSVTSLADTLDCKDLYVGRILVEQGSGLKQVVFLNNPGNSSGSYWTSFTNWTESDKASALSMLMAAKISQHKVHVVTSEPDGCGIQSGGRQANQILLATNP